MSTRVYNGLDMQSTRIENLGAPQNDNDAVRFADLNSAIEGFAWKDSCRVKSQANTNLASSPATIDGIALVSGDRVLIAAQSAPSQMPTCKGKPPLKSKERRRPKATSFS